MICGARTPDPCLLRNRDWRPSSRSRDWRIAVLALALLFGAPGCHLIVPDISHQPLVHNPFPQLSRVAVAPFFNQSDEKTLDGREVAMAYFAELQSIPGFEVVPVGVVEEAMIRRGVDLSGPNAPEEARRLARMLGVDVVVIGSLTDYSPYYPPRLGMRIEWYTANPGFHEIPPGYGLPWGSMEEEFIPPSLAYEADMARARAQLSTLTPDRAADAIAAGPVSSADNSMSEPDDARSRAPASEDGSGPEQDALESVPESLPPPPDRAKEESPASGDLLLNSLEINTEDNSQLWTMEAADPSSRSELPELIMPGVTSDTIVSSDNLGSMCLEQSSGIPALSSYKRPPCVIHDGPVMTHTRVYRGNEPGFTAALETYVHFRNDERFGGWQTYLRRSEDFIRFCCHLHISEMLSARGGAGETRVVCEWPASR